MTEAEPLSVSVRMRARAGMRDELVAGAVTTALASLEAEPGCLVFEVHVPTELDHDVLLHEIYTDDHSFAVTHRATAHYVAWRDVVARCVEPGSQDIVLARRVI